ncbi:amino acid permease [Asaia siamensis]|uniref:GABA permease GabP n=1 Tax=Asaia siamensis TaxID=110479 RepID=A0ABQ1LZ35_9PROT|nr:amino acid permease [Asaia siamensis]GBR02866.1 amino acid/polyamine transporter [Asaia siamensis NRIC 0323]GGC30684.1 putative GABA permease GabP [Asaia siamensis]
MMDKDKLSPQGFSQVGEPPLLHGGKLKDRHIAMIALGGVIGAGLFIGSSAAIAAAGPAILLTYMGTGLLVVIVIRMLGEMLLARPGIGTFIDCIRTAHGNWAGFLSGWLYWLFWVVTIGAEAIGGAIAMQDWVNLPVWVLAPFLIIAVNLINLVSVRVFGECEFWLSLIKVATIIAFCALGLLSLSHFVGPHPKIIHNVFNHDGLFPHGWGAILATVPTVLFSMIGSESATVAAAESENAEENLARVTRTIGVRVTLFYLLSVVLILTLVPWTSIEPGYSPFVTVMRHIGVPGAATLMQIVVFTAILSCLNSSIYITSRTLLGLAELHDAPKWFATLSRSHVPQRAVTFSSLIGLVVAFCSILSPKLIFAFLLGATGAVMLLIYGLIVSSHRVFRLADPQNRVFTLPFGTVLNLGTLAAIGLVVIAMLVQADGRQTIIASLVSVAAILGLYALCRKGR